MAGHFLFVVCGILYTFVGETESNIEMLNSEGEALTIINIIKNFKIMKRKDYQRPTIKIVKLQQRAHLLNASLNAERTGYGVAQESTWGEDE